MNTVPGMQLGRRSVLRGGLGVTAGMMLTPLAAGTSHAATRALYRGCVGEDVRALQKQLATKGYWCGTADGDFGELTQQATWAVQKQNGLTRDGVVGPLTRTALANGTLPKPVGGAGSRVEVHLRKQLFLVVRDGRTTRVLNTSTGNNQYYWLNGVRHLAVTPTGSWKVYSTYSKGWQWGPLGNLYRPMYYNSGWAVHGSAKIPPWPDSHGCSRLSTRAMDMIWSTGTMALGTRVTIATGA
ncbi:L,D-transpeptidase family protein [Ornithinimicrobium cerasi]|uniref:L,D-transpeptidase family protein n=1 Tax=Ornithinimicrobium cerasi TaxID=2248773 RepID=UPI001379654B|nr:L,D-transpeptidase family protein [Ornithinimicrobium cerasi]